MDDLFEILAVVGFFIISALVKGSKNKAKKKSGSYARSDQRQSESKLDWISDIAAALSDGAASVAKDAHIDDSENEPEHDGWASSMEGIEPEDHMHGGLLNPMPAPITPKDSEPFYGEGYHQNMDAFSMEGYEPLDHAHGGRMNPTTAEQADAMPAHRGVSRDQLRGAIIMAEILGPPASRRRRAIQ